jgi:acetyl esterase
MPLHSEVEELLGRLPTRKGLEKMTLAESRALAREGKVNTSKEPIFVLDLDCDGVPGRLYKPLDRLNAADKATKKSQMGHVYPQSEIDQLGTDEVDSDEGSSGEEELLGLCIFIHGGGWVIGDPDCYDDVCAKLANQSDCAILSLNYRKAPEHPFPAPLDDCIKGTRWAYNFCEVLGCDPQRIVVCGDSAGGNLATLVTQYSFVPIQMQILIYPVCDCRLALMNSHESGSYKDFESGYLLTKESMKWFVNLYLGGEEAHKSGEVSNETLKLAQDPRASPLLASDDVLKAMPPALIITAEYDPLRDEGEDYARRLSSIGVKCSLVRYFGQVHSFFNLLHEGLEDSFLLVAHVAHTISRALRPSGATTPAGGGRGGKGVGKKGATGSTKKKQQKQQAVASELLSMGDASNSGRDTPTSFYYRNRRDSSDVGSRPYSESSIYKAANAYSTAVLGILEAHSGDKTTPGLSPGMMGDEGMGGIDDADAAVGGADIHMRPRQLFQGKSNTLGNHRPIPRSSSQSRSRSPGGVKATNKVQFSPYLKGSDNRIIEITPKEAKRLRNARFEYYDQVRQRQQQGLLKSNSPDSSARFSALLNTISKDDSTADHIVRTPVEVQLMKEVLELEGQMRSVEMEKKSKEYFQWLRDREAYYERAASTDIANDSSSNSVAPSPYRHVLTAEMKESLKKLKHDQKTRAAQRTTYTTEHTRAYMEWVKHNLNAEVGTPGAVKHKVVTGESKHETLLKKFACLHLKQKKQADRRQKVKEANAVNSINAKMIKAVSDHMKYRKPRVDSNRDGQKDAKTLTLEQYHAIKIKTLMKGRQIEESMTPEDKMNARLRSRSPSRGARSKLGDPTEVTLAEAITFNSIDEAPPPPRHREMYVRHREMGTPGSSHSNSPYAKGSTPGSTSRGRSRGRKDDASPEGHAPKAGMRSPDFQPGVLYYFDESGNSHAIDSKHAHAVIHSQSPRSIDVIRREEHHNRQKKHHVDGHSPYEEHRRKEEEMAVRRQARLSTMNSEKHTNKNIGYSALTGATPEYFAPESASVEAGHINNNNSRKAKEKNVAGTIAAGADVLSKPGLSVSFKHQKDFTMVSKHVSKKWRAGNSNIMITEVKTGQGFKDQIRAIYTEYNPDRLDMIDTICATFEGREDTLLMELGKKYDFLVDLVDHEAEAREAARLAEQTRIQELEQRIRELESEKAKAKTSPSSSKKRGQSPSFKPPTPPVDPQDQLKASSSSSPSQSVSSSSVSSSPAEAPLSIIRVAKHKDGKAMPESSKSPRIDLSSHELKHEDIDVTMICDDPEEWKEQLTQIYKRYNPERLAILDDIIETFEGRKVALMNQLGAKYGFKVHLKASTHSTRQREHIKNRLHLHREASRQAEMRAREYHSSSDSSNSSDDDDASSLTHSDDGMVNHQTMTKAKAVSDLLTASKKANEVIQAKHRDVLRGSTTIDSPGSSESGSTTSSMSGGVDANGNPKLKRAHTIHKPRVTAAMEEEAPDRAKMIKEIMAIWQVYEPTKPTLLIDRILDQFEGREAALLANLKKKFHIPDDLTSREASKKVKKASKKAKKEKENAARSSSSSSLTVSSKKDRGLEGTTFMPPSSPVASSPAPAPAASTALSSGRALTSASKSNRTVPLSASSIHSQQTSTHNVHTSSGLHTITEHHGEAASDDNSSSSSSKSSNLSNGSSPETKIAPPAMRPPSPPRHPSPSSGTKNKKQSSSPSSPGGKTKNAAAGGGGRAGGSKYDPDANPELDMDPEMAPPPAPQSSSDIMMDHEHEQQQKLRSNSPNPSEVVARLNSVVSTTDTFLSNTLRRGGLGIYGYKDKYNDAVKERTLKVDEKGRLVYASASFKSRKLFGAEEKWPLGQLSRVVLRRPGMELGLAKTHTCAGLTEITLKFREGKRGDRYDSGKKVSDLVFFCQDKSIEQIAIDSFKRVIVEVMRDRDAWMTLYAPHRSAETTPSGSNRNTPPPSR